MASFAPFFVPARQVTTYSNVFIRTIPGYISLDQGPNYAERKVFTFIEEALKDLPTKDAIVCYKNVGIFNFEVDMFIRINKTNYIVEINGYQHWINEKQARRDRFQQILLENMGFKVLQLDYHKWQTSSDAERKDFLNGFF